MTKKILSKFLFSVTFLCLVTTFVFAAITFNTIAPTNIVEDVTTYFNISVNNTDPAPATANITQVNITLPSSFTFLASSNITASAPAAAFTNTSTVLSWSNVDLVGALLNRSFQFNATASTPGWFNITIQASNSTTTVTGNISILVNDTTVPSSVVYNTPGKTGSAANSTSTLIINISTGDNGVVDRILIRLYNSTRDQVNTSLSTSGAASYTGNFTGLTNGTYYVNATVNDTYNNVNHSITMTVVVDPTSPSVTHECTPTSVDRDVAITCTCSGTDSGGTGVASTIYDPSPITNTYGTFTTTCAVTDYAGNAANSSISYTVNAPSSGSSGGGGSSSNPLTVWSNTIVKDKDELSTMGDVSVSMAKKARVRVMVGGSSHYVGVKDLTSTSATIEVNSTPQQASINVGETKKFNLDGDNDYDISVTLSKIESNKADLVIRAVNEAIPATESPTTTTTDVPSDSVDGETSSAKSSRTLMIVVIAIILIIAVVAFVVFFNKKR